MRRLMLTAACTALLAGCGGPAPLPPEATFGPNPTLFAPRQGWVPTVKVA